MTKQLDKEIDFLRAELAGLEDSPEGFEAFFELMFSFPLKEHIKDAIVLAYKAHKINRGLIAVMWRGAAKTTGFTQGLAAFKVGHFPLGTSLLVQAGDDIARDNSRQVADIIRYNKGWKMAFPHVVPDFERGWASTGYFVKQTHTDRTLLESISKEEWISMVGSSKDPSFVGLGYKSSSIIGKRPTNLLLLDDIHDDKNTISDRELNKVKRVYTGTILPTVAPEAMQIIVGTPWNKRDIIAAELSTGNYESIKVSVIKEKGTITYHCDNCGERGYSPIPSVTSKEWKESPEGFCPNCMNVTSVTDTNVYTWPERFGRMELAKRLRSSGKIEYARMYLVNLDAAANAVFTYFPFPSDRIDPTWRMVGGVDYAGTMDEARNRSGRNDYFAMCYVAVNENNVAVVTDGIIEHVTQGRAETLVNKPQGLFSGWQYSVVEGDGKGEEFIQTIMRNPGLRIVPKKTGGKGKAQRLEKQMSPWLESGRVRISDAETPFLNELRAELDDYPNNDYDDALDALYWALRGLPDVLYFKEDDDSLTDFYDSGNESTNPYASLF